MLRELRAKNLAVIESADVAFGPGLNVLTGETGAGKSILNQSFWERTFGRTGDDVAAR